MPATSLTRTDTNGDVTTFSYDYSDQLVGESRGNGHGLGYSLAFTYDHNRASTRREGHTEPQR